MWFYSGMVIRSLPRGVRGNYPLNCLKETVGTIKPSLTLARHVLLLSPAVEVVGCEPHPMYVGVTPILDGGVGGSCWRQGPADRSRWEQGILLWPSLNIHPYVHVHTARSQII